MKTFILILLKVLFNMCGGAKILAIFPTPAVSHQNAYRPLVQELVKRGHEVTVVTPNSLQYTDRVYANLTQIDVHDISYSTNDRLFNFVDVAFTDMSIREIMLRVSNTLIEVCDQQLSTTELQRLIHDNDVHFDLVLSEAVIPIPSAFKDRFKSPLILINSMGYLPHHLDNIGNPVHPVLYPDVFASYDPQNMYIWQKLDLILRHYLYKAHLYAKFLPLFNEIAGKYFGKDTRSVMDIESEADMLFVTHNPVWHGVRPTVPAAIDISGIHIKPPQPLPEDLQTFLDEAKVGAIYFSFGSNVKSSQLPEHKKNIFLKTFENFAYKVMWKYEDDYLSGKPDNIYISKWLPQTSILAHPNVKLFITQGGQQSVEEAIVNEVPMIVIPFLFDQISNAQRIEKHKVGKNILLKDLSEENLKKAITDVMTPRYRQNIAKLRSIYFDSPQSALERAVWWTEYVIRHKGARHLRSPAAEISYFEYFMIDVILYLIVSTAVTVYSMKRLWSFFQMHKMKFELGSKKKLYFLVPKFHFTKISTNLGFHEKLK